jgi:hypothetical protein
MAKLTNILRNNGVIEKLRKSGNEGEIIKFFIDIENKHMMVNT